MCAKNKKKIILTFDLDFWYNGSFLKRYLPSNTATLEDFVEKPTTTILDLLDEYNQKATFFVLGEIAEKYPQLIADISSRKHEIASHGYSHDTLQELGPQKFEQEIIKVNRTIKEVTGQQPIGFRAPNFSLNQRTSWGWNILTTHGYQYDSSIHPFALQRNAPRITEIPSSVGGIYFRMLPFSIFKYLATHLSKTKVPVLYFHPYEFFKETPRVQSAPWLKRKIKYFGINRALGKFEKLLQEIHSVSIQQYIYENSSH